MTIFASHFALVLGAWRLRIRIDLDEPRASELDEYATVAARSPEASQRATHEFPSYAPRGRG